MLVARRTLLRGLVAIGDTVTIVVAFACSYLLVGRMLGRHFISFGEYTWLLVIITPVWLSCLWIFDLYASASYDRLPWLITHLLKVHVIASLLLLSAMYLTKSIAVSRLLLQTFIGTSLALLILQKVMLKAAIEYLRGRDCMKRRRVLLVGTPEQAMSYMDFVRAHTSMYAEIIGFLDPSDAPQSHVEFTHN